MEHCLVMMHGELIQGSGLFEILSNNILQTRLRGTLHEYASTSTN